MSNITALKKQAEALLAKFDTGKCYAIGDLHDRLQKTVAEYPQDAVIQAVAHVVDELNYKHPEKVVSQAEFEGIYNQLVGLNATGTRFREVLGDLLKTAVAEVDNTNERFVRGMRDDNSMPDIEYDVDKELRHGLDGAFSVASDKYDPRFVSLAKEKVSLELKSIGFTPRIKIAGGNSRFIVFATDFDTTRGLVRLFVPADATGKTFPSVFVAGEKVIELNAQNLTDTLQAAVNDLTHPAVFGSRLDDKVIELPRVATPEPLKLLASEIEESVLEASVGFTQDVVRLAKRMLAVELNSMGFVNSQVRVTVPTNDGFICEATLNTPRGKLNIEVPIEIKNNSPLLPSVFAKDDFVDDFTSQKLHIFAMRDDVSVSSINRESPLFEMSLPQLKDVIIRAASKNDFDTCNEALDIIASNFDGETHRVIVADYLKMLMSFGSAQSNMRQAYDDSSQFVRTPTSIYPIHKKLGRPIQDLVRDENGEYHLKSTYYARQAQAAESVLFNTAKVLVGD